MLAALFDNFVLSGFTIPIQCLNIWYFMALIFIENPITFGFNQQIVGFVLLAIATPNFEKAFKAFILKVLSLLSLLIMLAIFYHSC